MMQIVDELFDSLRLRYQGNLGTSMEGSKFIFDSVQMMYYKCHKVNFGRGGSYINSPDQIKKKKATISPKNTDDKVSNPERVSNIKQYINKFKWKAINYPSKINDWKTLEKNNLTIALNVLYIKEKEIYPAYISKINSNCEKQIILLMISNEQEEG